MSQFEKTSEISTRILRKREVSLFYHFEPYDGPDGIPPKHEPGGARFQKSMMMSTKRIRPAIANNRGGKTLSVAVEGTIMMTGELPFSLRYPDGADTGIPRALRSQHDEMGMINIRWRGRRDKETGQIIDHNEDANEDGAWDCGNIVGVGRYPETKICKAREKQWWICCWKTNRDTRWIALMKNLIPEHCLDKTRGVDGFSTKSSMWYLKEDRVARCITYEQGIDSVEAEEAYLVTLDEEPRSREFYTGVDLHAVWIMMSYTPIHGMTWAYDDIYIPARDQTDPQMELFHATVYDCPFFDQEKLTHLEKTLKAHEIDAKLYGFYSKREGRPYFPYDICKGYVDNFRPRHRMLGRIVPAGKCETMNEILHTPMRIVPAEEPGPDVWEIYEEPKDNFAYWSAQDCAKGSDDPNTVQDMSVCYFFRRPTDKEIAEEKPWPKMVAALYSSDVPENFAMLCLYAAIFYNRALLGPETKGEQGASFLTEIREYPHILTTVVINQRTRKPTPNLGFNTNSGTRTSSINKIRKWINAHPDESFLYHFELLKEILDLVWKKGRPDHPDGGKSDCVIALAIIFYIWDECNGQIRNNRPLPEKGDKPIWKLFSQMMPEPRKRVLGRRGRHHMHGPR